LRKFVMDKSNTAFNRDKFKVGMYLFLRGIQRRCPICAQILTDGAGSPKIQVLSEIAAYPLGFILYFDPEPDFKMPCLDITSFCDFSYEQECKMQISLPIYECNIVFPVDFRSKKELKACRDEILNGK